MDEKLAPIPPPKYFNGFTDMVARIGLGFFFWCGIFGFCASVFVGLTLRIAGAMGKAPLDAFTPLLYVLDSLWFAASSLLSAVMFAAALAHLAGQRRILAAIEAQTRALDE